MSLLKQLEVFGVQTLGRPDADAVLRYLHVGRKMKAEDVAKKFGVTAEAVRYHLRRLGIARHQPTFEVRVKKAAYSGVDHFFTRCAMKTFKDMAEELGLTANAVIYQYNKWMAAKMRRMSEPRR